LNHLDLLLGRIGLKKVLEWSGLDGLAYTILTLGEIGFHKLEH
jgi:hypothetical protein